MPIEGMMNLCKYIDTIKKVIPDMWRAFPFCFTSPQPFRPQEASNSVSTIRDVMYVFDRWARSALLLTHTV